MRCEKNRERTCVKKEDMFVYSRQREKKVNSATPTKSDRVGKGRSVSANQSRLTWSKMPRRRMGRPRKKL